MIYKNLFTFLLLIFFLQPITYAEVPSPLYEDFPKMEETQAYKRFLAGPDSDYAILLFLINRFDKTKIQIQYDGHHYSTVFAAPVARWFLSRHYRKQTPREWISQYCDRSVFSHHPVWVVLPDGTHVRSREVLIRELETLEALMAKRDSQEPSQGAS